MLGSAAFQYLSDRFPGSVYATARSPAVKRIFPRDAANITVGIDVENADALTGFLRDVRPDVVLNCVGVVKQLASAEDPLVAIPINSIMPHRLARLADLVGARLVHISTDCVFTGRKGDYRESDVPDAEDLYGRSKLLGEVDYPNAVTLRTSIIGREIGSRNGLVEWFLSQSGAVRGYKRAIFSGLTTDELVRVIVERVLPNPGLRGVYHVSVDPISKFDLLGIVRDAYGVVTEIEPDDAVAIDRSLNSDRFRAATGYAPPSWPDLIRSMRRFDEESFSQVR
ncbi:dTDP-4-dehydrorhamnose reductase [Methylorubrum thiocyanatum]